MSFIRVTIDVAVLVNSSKSTSWISQTNDLQHDRCSKRVSCLSTYPLTYVTIDLPLPIRQLLIWKTITTSFCDAAPIQ